MFAAVLVDMVARMIIAIDKVTHNGLSILANQINRVGNSFSYQLEGSCCQNNAKTGEQEHGQRQADDLADYLRALRFGIAAEVRNVQRQCRPESDHRSQAGHEVAEQRRAFGSARRYRQQGLN